MKSNNVIQRATGIACVSVLALALGACGKKDEAPPAPPPAKVSVVTLKTETVALTTQLPGRTSAYRIAEVRPQVNGIVQKRLFTEGGEVKQGQQLYQIDPAIYQAEVDNARASLARAQATQKTAARLVERYAPLAKTRAVAQQTYDESVASRDQAAADVQSAKAALDTARINLVYTKVLAPISGLIGRSNFTEGALVAAQQANAMATIQQIDPIYVDVTQSSIELLRLQQDLAAGRLQRAEGAQAARVTLMLEDGTPYDQPGKLMFSEVTVDPTTSSVLIRAEFPNPKRRLLPGMFVRAQLPGGVDDNALLVPQRGVTRNQRGEPTALVVSAENKAELRNLKTDRAIGDKWLVTDGLKVGDRVIVEGLQSVRPGAQVQIVDAATKPGQTPAAGAAGAAPAGAAPAANGQGAGGNADAKAN